MIEIYHAARKIFTGDIRPDIHGNPEADFGEAMYFGYTYDAALSFLSGHSGYILSRTVDDCLSDDYNIGLYTFKNQYQVYNFGDYNTVVNNETLQIEFMRELISHHVPYLGFPQTNYDVYIGPRADRNADYILKSNICYPGDYDDVPLLMDVFDQLHCEQYSSQIAFKPSVCGLFYEVFEDNWEEA